MQPCYLQLCHIPTIITRPMRRHALPHNLLKTWRECKLPGRLIDRYGQRNSKSKIAFAQYPVSYAGEIKTDRSEGISSAGILPVPAMDRQDAGTTDSRDTLTRTSFAAGDGMLASLRQRSIPLSAKVSTFFALHAAHQAAFDVDLASCQPSAHTARLAAQAAPIGTPVKAAHAIVVAVSAVHRRRACARSS